MIEPTEADVGRKVVYRRPKLAWADGSGSEEGIITSMNASLVFVRYGCDVGSKGTKREDLEWMALDAVPAAPVPPFRTGDSVLHGPTGETWVVAYADPASGYMSWLGWPEGEARISDCTLDEAASDEKHQEWLARLNKSGGNRAARAIRLYGEPTVEVIDPPVGDPECGDSVASSDREVM